MEPYQKKITALMVRQKLLVAQLYDIFSDTFPKYATFWHELAKEEKKHATWIKKLCQAEEKCMVTFNEGKIRTYTMNTYIDYMENIIKQAKNGKFDMKMAAAITLHIEMSLIEKNFITHFQIIDPDCKGIIIMLERETKKHIKKAQDLVASFR